MLSASVVPPRTDLCQRSGDYDTSYPPEARRYLRTYGLTPPARETYEIQAQRCKTLPNCSCDSSENPKLIAPQV